MMTLFLTNTGWAEFWADVWDFIKSIPCWIWEFIKCLFEALITGIWNLFCSIVESLWAWRPLVCIIFILFVASAVLLFLKWFISKAIPTVVGGGIGYVLGLVLLVIRMAWWGICWCFTAIFKGRRYASRRFWEKLDRATADEPSRNSYSRSREEGEYSGYCKSIPKYVYKNGKLYRVK